MNKTGSKEIIPTLTIAILILSLFSGINTSVSATSIDTLSMCNIEGYPGDTITEYVQLTGNMPDRIGHWRTSYKHIEGDDVAKMDIRSWITITPENYTLAEGEVKTFTVEIRIPHDAESGLYGATSPEAGLIGHSDDRRTYILYEDADATAVMTGENVAYTGLLIPVSVIVLSKPTPTPQVTPSIKECDTTARAIIKAVGGCGAIDKSKYSMIYEACCKVTKDYLLDLLNTALADGVITSDEKMELLSALDIYLDLIS
jgi:hypothetical protein